MAPDSLAAAFLSAAAAETLLLIDVINAEGRLIVHTVWATTADRRAGPRVTRVEQIPEGVNARAALIGRLTELALAICWDPKREPAANYPP